MGDIGFGSDKGGKKKGKGGRKKGPTAQVKLYAALKAKYRGKLTKKELALRAGFSESMAENAKAKIEDPNKAYFALLGDAAISDEEIWLLAREGAYATAVKTASFAGEITDMKEFADFKVRREYLDMIAEWKGHTQRRGAGAHAEINMPITLIHSVPRPNNGTDKIGS